MIIISNGFSKFHLGPAAAEIYRRDKLTAFITGAYPTWRVRVALKLLRLNKYSRIARLIGRAEPIPDSMITSLMLPEAIAIIGSYLMRWTPTRWLGAGIYLSAHRYYSYRAKHSISRFVGRSKIYHYRAGFGGSSVLYAKKHGLIALCDHSIAHPALIEHFVQNKGAFPQSHTTPKISPFWANVQADIDVADYVLVNSEFVKQTFLHQRWSSPRIEVIYLGVDDQFLASIVSRLRPVCGPLRLLFAGEFGMRKGADVLITALQSVNDVPWQLNVAGAITPDIKKKFATIWADERIQLLGTLPRSRLAYEMAHAEIFVFPTLVEGSARVVFEALACGCYVITTPNCGSVVENGIHGALVEPGDVTGLAAAIRAAYRNRQNLAEISSRNSTLIREHFTQVCYGELLNELYSKIIANQNKMARSRKKVELKK